MDEDGAKKAIAAIRDSTLGDKATSGATSLINLIPYAGGAVASLIGEYANHRKTEKICEVLSDLNERLSRHGSDPSQHLSKDEVVEVVHNVLPDAAVTSDEKKISSLKNALAYSFIEEDPFEAKQLFLETLKSCTTLDMRILRAVYNGGDPYIVHEPEPQANPTVGSLGMASITMASVLVSGTWRPTENRDCGRKPLVDELAGSVSCQRFLVEGAAHRLDGRGLTSLQPNLGLSRCKVHRLDQANVLAVSSYSLTGHNILPTPIEASKTEFGDAFLRFCSY